MRILGPIITFVDRPWKVSAVCIHFLDLHNRRPLLHRCILLEFSLDSVGHATVYLGIDLLLESLLGFDTASSIALLAVSAIAKKGSDGKSIPSQDIVILPVIVFHRRQLVTN